MFKIIAAIRDYFNNAHNVRKYEFEPLLSLLMRKHEEMLQKNADGSPNLSMSSGEMESVQTGLQFLRNQIVEINITGGDALLSPVEADELLQITINLITDMDMVMKLDLYKVFSLLNPSDFIKILCL